MNCPLCNALIREGSLYCEKCGEDIHIVPDFEPEIEDTCRETIESMAQGMTHLFVNEEKERDNIQQTDSINKKQKLKKILCVCIPILSVIIIGVGAYFFFINTGTYKLNKANKAFANFDYGTAARYYNDVIKLNNDNIQAIENYGSCMLIMGNTDAYENIVRELCLNTKLSEERRNEYIELMISLLEERNDYEAVRDLLISSSNNDLLTKYSYYFISSPEIVNKSGEYDMPQLLEIKSESDETVYYTVEDGAGIVVDNEKYSEAVLLSEGNYKISAYTMNELGMKSDSVYAEIKIVLDVPKTPTINTVSGEIFEPGFIEVDGYNENHNNIYYSIDGSDPDTNSRKYNGRVVILPGAYTYKFINIGANGLSSDITEVYINFNIEWNVKVENAISAVKYNMFENGITSTPDGNMEDGTVVGVEFSSIEKRENEYYYIFDKVAFNPFGGATYFNEQYGVNVLTGEIIRL